MTSTKVALSQIKHYSDKFPDKSQNSGNESTNREKKLSDEACISNIMEKSQAKYSNVGFSSLPKQIYRKANQVGFYFNLLITGSSGLGKSTFINSLFQSDIYNNAYPTPSVRYYRNRNVDPISSATFNLTENNVNLTLTIVDTPGFGESLDNTSCWKPLIDEINRRNSEYMDLEVCKTRITSGPGSVGKLGVLPEKLIHICFYFIRANGHSLHMMDLETMRHLSNKVNLIPVIAKADSMTTEECRSFKALVKNELSQEGIKVYEFPPINIHESGVEIRGAFSVEEVNAMRLRQPFAVSTSQNEIAKDGKMKVRGRVYPWGTVETENLNHNDFQALKSLIMNIYMQDLIDSTYLDHYANFRSERLTAAMEASNFCVTDGRDPLSQLEAERRDHQVKLEKLLEEMDSVYVEKVRDRELRLKDTERDMLERIEYMKHQLSAEADDLSAARRKFDEQRVSWEMENRENADSAMNSCEKLEKIKKRRGLF